MEFFWQSLQTTKLEKERERGREKKTLIRFVSGNTRYKYYALTKPASILVASYKGFVFAFNNNKMWVQFTTPHSLDKGIHYFFN